MTNSGIPVIGGVDTHKHTHYAAAIDDQGRLIGHHEFPATARGYRDLLEWLRSHGQIEAIGVEGTGNFGASLTRHLSSQGEHVLEVNKPNRQARHMEGKSDRLDAEQIARAVLAETGIATPKSKSGPVEVIRMLRAARSSAVRARTQAFNLLFHTMVSGPSEVRDSLVDVTRRTLVNRCLDLVPETENILELVDDPDRMVLASLKLTLRDLARRWKVLDGEIKKLNHQIKELVEYVAPDLVQMFGVSTELAGQFLVTAGDNPERTRNEAASKSKFRHAFTTGKRILIPADAFYEWTKTGGPKVPNAFRRTDGEPIVFAGLCEYWKAPDDQWLASATIITTSDNPDMHEIHNRMPVILEESTWDEWMNPESEDLDEHGRAASARLDAAHHHLSLIVRTGTALHRSENSGALIQNKVPHSVGR